MGNNCCECNNKNVLDDSNFGDKIKFNEDNKENILTSNNIDKNNTYSININFTQTNNDTLQKDQDYQISIKSPRVPKDIISDTIINSRKKLKLIIKQSKYLVEGKEYIINAGGLIGSPRNLKNGITLFGDASVSAINIIKFIHRLTIKMILNFQTKNQKIV
jgi:hypothetical protein